MTKKLPPVEEQRRRAERAEIRRQVVDQVTKEAWRKASKAIADQTVTHHRQTAVLAANYVAMKDALAAAVRLIDWLRPLAGGRVKLTRTGRVDEFPYSRKLMRRCRKPGKHPHRAVRGKT